jgi:hypothetical protein
LGKARVVRPSANRRLKWGDDQEGDPREDSSDPEALDRDKLGGGIAPPSGKRRLTEWDGHLAAGDNSPKQRGHEFESVSHEKLGNLPLFHKAPVMVLERVHGPKADARESTFVI